MENVEFHVSVMFPNHGIMLFRPVIRLAASTVRLQVLDYSQLSDYSCTEWLAKYKAADAPITFEEIVICRYWPKLCLNALCLNALCLNALIFSLLSAHIHWSWGLPINILVTNLVLIMGYLHSVKYKVEWEEIDKFECASAEAKHPTRKRSQSTKK